MNQRQLSMAVWGRDTHRGIIQEWSTKSDPRCSTLVKVCRVLGISTDSLFQKSESVSVNPIIKGNGIVVDSNNVNIEIADLKAENKSLNLVIDEKDRRIELLEKCYNDLSKRFDTILELWKSQGDNNRE